MTITSTSNDTAITITDAGLETVLIFEHGFDLPEFAAFPLLDDANGQAALRSYYNGFLDIAERRGVALSIDTPTWRATSNWGSKLGYDAQDLHRLNTAAAELLRGIVAERDTGAITISGCVGPADDGYVVGEMMSASEATEYYLPQMQSLADAGVDTISAITMTYVAEAIGVTQAAMRAGVPIVLAFTVETDGRLPSGELLADAIEAVDAATQQYVTHFGVNCAHPDHFSDTLVDGSSWCERIGLVRTNASRLSHEELDNAPDLDPGDPVELAADIASLRARFPSLTAIGGCCGTSHVHIEEMARAALAVTS